MHNAAKYICLALGTLLLLSAVLYTVKSNFTVGTGLAYALGTLLLAYGLLYGRISTVLPLWAKLCFAFVLAFVAVFVISVYICGANDTVNYREDAVIVLGAGVKGEKIGSNLQERLDTALEYHEKNPNAVIVVSGGKGNYETISEALAMERYLLQNGVPQDKIIKEDRSTSTEENFAFSKKILDSHFEREYTAAYITNGFHIYRAGCLGKAQGIEGLTHLSAKTPWYTIVPNGLREMLAILKIWIFG